MINHRNKQNYRFRTWKFRDRCHLTGGVRQGCFLSLILNNLIQYIHFHSSYITSHYYAKFKENPCVGTDARPPLHRINIVYFKNYIIRPFLCFTNNQFAKKMEFLANLITYYVNICNLLSKLFSKSVKWAMRPFLKAQSWNRRSKL